MVMCSTLFSYASELSSTLLLSIHCFIETIVFSVGCRNLKVLLCPSFGLVTVIVFWLVFMHFVSEWPLVRFVLSPMFLCDQCLFRFSGQCLPAGSWHWAASTVNAWMHVPWVQNIIHDWVCCYITYKTTTLLNQCSFSCAFLSSIQSFKHMLLSMFTWSKLC